MTSPVRKMKIIEKLKNMNRTLLEMQAGMLFFGLVCQVAGLIFAPDQGGYALSLWFGVAFAFAGSIHMYRTLDRALYCGKDASAMVTRGYLFRYIVFGVALVLVAMTGFMNPLVFFLGYMGLKVTAYMQPLTHKLCNRLFHETDPEPEPLVEEPPASQEEDAAAQDVRPHENI